MQASQEQQGRQQNENVQQTGNAGIQLSSNNENDLANRLQDGTNDFQNGDPGPSREQSSQKQNNTQKA